MEFLSGFKWYRRRRGGIWSKVTWGCNPLRVAYWVRREPLGEPENETLLAIEDYATLRPPQDWRIGIDAAMPVTDDPLRRKRKSVAIYFKAYSGNRQRIDSWADYLVTELPRDAKR